MKPAIPTAAHKIRIIGGKHRGRRIMIPDRDGLRPSPDRVRETLFNWLQWEIAGAHVLDAFAGSGALGLEALSRGAASVLFADNDTDGVARLRALLAEWHEAHARVQAGDVFLLSPSAARYDLIFLDPPFAAGLHAQAVTHFVNDRWLKEQGKVYLEMPFPHEDLQVPPGWLWHRQGRAGRVFFGLLRRDYADEAAA
ncbi:MAG: 16S rRNA (guanine(966)-N(2))-methyltransferase RsmD [Cardiobacterium sp.]|jgi:RNA methyltransferase, rsmD family